MDRKVFGAHKHHYRSTPAPERAVRRLEADLGVLLPTQYRAFLPGVGSGAGPYYGLWGPAEAWAQLHGLAQNYQAEERKTIRPGSAFPLTSEDLRGIESVLLAGAEPWIVRDWPCEGCLPICEQGCTFYSVLALTGEFAGRVFDLNDAGGYSGEWRPALRPPGWLECDRPQLPKLPPLPSPPTFGEWFAGWVERCLADLAPDVKT